MAPQKHLLTLHDLLQPLKVSEGGEPHFIVFTTRGDDVTDTLTRSELRAAAAALASRLLQRTRPGSRALISLPTGPDFFVAFFGCLYAGIVAVPIQPVHNARTMERLEAIAVESGADLLLTSQSIADRLQLLDSSFLSRALPQVMIVGASKSVADTDMPIYDPDPDRVAYLQFTSGSTGQPRGVMISHRNVLANLAVIDAKAGLDGGDSAVSWLPLHHDMGLVSAFYAMYAGLPLVSLSPMHYLQRPLRWLKAISHFRAVISCAPNFAYDLCSAAEPSQDELEMDLTSWQVAFCGSEMIRPAALRRFTRRFERFGFRTETLSPSYGLAEFTLMVTGVPAQQQPEFRSVQITSLTQGSAVATAKSDKLSAEISECGTIGTGHRIQVVDPTLCQRQADGQVGEIWVAGPSKALGYWQRPEETKATFQARLEGDDEAYLRTGDLGFLNAGQLFVTGRIKEIIVIRGKNHHPREIEDTASHAHPALSSSVAAFGDIIADKEALVLVSEVRRGSWRHSALNDVPLAIQDELVRRLGLKADFIGLVKPGSIPRTSSGKLQRLKCREHYRAGLLEFLETWPGRSADYEGDAAPTHAQFGRSRHNPERPAIEKWIVQWLALRLQITAAAIDRHRPLSAYGVDSLGAVQLSQALEDWLRVPVSETLAWSYPTIQELGAHLEQILRQESPAIGGAHEPPAKSPRSEVESALESVERLSELQIENLHRRRVREE
jgi:acyl-CoA synthetase (AMP-forming)/AMP-acid ligase II/acyl carrier protein